MMDYRASDELNDFTIDLMSFHIAFYETDYFKFFNLFITLFVKTVPFWETAKRQLHELAKHWRCNTWLKPVFATQLIYVSFNN